MKNVIVTFEYRVNLWDFFDAEEHATVLATDLSGEIDETVEDEDGVHQIFVIVPYTTVSDVREGLYELSAAQEGVIYRVEATD